MSRASDSASATHVASVLRGQTSEQVLARGRPAHHVRLLPDASVAEVRGYIEQLLGAGLLRQTDDVYPVVALTRKGLELLKDPASSPDWRSPASGRHERANHARSLASRRNRGKTSIATSSNGCVRSDQIARSRGVPPYVIFHDATLREMARLRPRRWMRC